ncbi:MAG: polyprenol monophosphomannose synthase [Candidatus Thorarchaeota archaeon]|nr:polyprenol monophosphomannose synthase [Candidatus Thorarchaeota archaeon]
MRCSVIIPTLNEEGNIQQLIESIYAQLSPDETDIYIVDDDSKDRTQEIVTTLTRKYPRLHLIVRKGERGLGTAVRLGATHVPDGPVVVMDADFSHDPRFIPALLKKVREGFDIVVGSRYVTGGRIIGWTGLRIAISKGATMIARILLRVPLKDPMSGFVACSSPKILVDSIKLADYKLLLEIVARNKNLRVTEVPIAFRDRTRGQSKLGSRTLFLYVLLVFRLLFMRQS